MAVGLTPSPVSALELSLTVLRDPVCCFSGINLGLSYSLSRLCTPAPVGLEAPASCFSSFPMIGSITTHFLPSAHCPVLYLLPAQVLTVKGLRGRFSPSPGTLQFVLSPFKREDPFIWYLKLSPVSTFLFSLQPTGQYFPASMIQLYPPYFFKLFFYFFIVFYF